jgi:hypothetical protein
VSFPDTFVQTFSAEGLIASPQRFTSAEAKTARVSGPSFVLG